MQQLLRTSSFPYPRSWSVINFRSQTRETQMWNSDRLDSYDDNERDRERLDKSTRLSCQSRSCTANLATRQGSMKLMVEDGSWNS